MFYFKLFENVENVFCFHHFNAISFGINVGGLALSALAITAENVMNVFHFPHTHNT